MFSLGSHVICVVQALPWVRYITTAGEYEIRCAGPVVISRPHFLGLKIVLVGLRPKVVCGECRRLGVMAWGSHSTNQVRVSVFAGWHNCLMHCTLEASLNPVRRPSRSLSSAERAGRRFRRRMPCYMNPTGSTLIPAVFCCAST